MWIAEQFYLTTQLPGQNAVQLSMIYKCVHVYTQGDAKYKCISAQTAAS